MSAEQTSINTQILWEPSESYIANSNLKKFSDKAGVQLFPYEQLHQWSTANPDEFWSAVWEDAEIEGRRGKRVFVPGENGEMISAQWFPDARLNFAENVLRGEAGRPAVYEAGEAGVSRELTIGELRSKVAKVQKGLRELGVGKGDRVAAVIKNEVEGLVALLASASLGAVWTSCSPDFGAKGIIDRIGQVEPKVLIATPEYQYKGKLFNIRENISTVSKELDSLSAVVTIGDNHDLYIDSSIKLKTWEQLCDNTASDVEYTQLPFDHPLYILYTSGTTGLPKAIVHSAGGTLLQHVKEHRLHCDVKPGDVMFWYTNTAWMMYPWLVSGLASGAAILLYDGSPVGKGQPGILWEIAEQAGVTHFGTSPKYLETLAKADYKVREKHDLPKLRSVLSCGSPLSAEQYDWVYENIKKDLLLASISGGTEIIGCFVMGSPVHPVKRGEIACKALGMAVDVVDDKGKTVVNKKGDLVCTSSFPSMPITFWGDDGYDRYYKAYFSQRPGIWTHGDFAEQTTDKTMIIYGRADTTLNPGGVRIGTAEIYRVVEQLPQIEDSLVFGLPTINDEEIVLLVVVKDGEWSTELQELIRKEIRKKATPRHVPKRIFSVSEIPYTINGKKVEGAARSAVTGEPVKNKASLANPESLVELSNLLEAEGSRL